MFNSLTLHLSCYTHNGDASTQNSRFPLSAKRTSPFKSAGASVQSITGSRGVRISGSNAGHTKFRGSVKGTGYPFLSPVSPSLPLAYVTVCHHISAGVYLFCPDLLCWVGETSYGIRVGLVVSTHNVEISVNNSHKHN